MEMSINRLMLLQQAAAPAAEAEAPDWLLQMLRETLTAVAKEEGDTLKKAGMIARLGALYLRASGAAELKRAAKELARRCAHLEEQLAALQRSVPTAAPPAAGTQVRQQSTRGTADSLASSGAPRVSVRTPIAPELDAPRLLAVGPDASRDRAAPALPIEAFASAARTQRTHP
jgi:hypothetical protein